MTRPDPAVVGWCVVLGVALAVDGWLIRNGHATLSSAARNSPHSRRAARMLAGHLTDQVPGDPLNLLARLISERRQAYPHKNTYTAPRSPLL